MSTRPPPEILSFFADYAPTDFARAGTVASRTFTLPGGMLNSRGGEITAEDDVPLAHGVEPNLRKLGLPTRLVKGRVELDGDFTVCKEGDTLGSGQTTLLKMFGVAMAEFRVGIVTWWERDTQKVEVAEGEGGDLGNRMVEDDDHDDEDIDE